MSGMNFDGLKSDEAARLEEQFIVEEVSSALLELSGDKERGPNGFSMDFW